jgi:hypothetical protein
MQELSDQDTYDLGAASYEPTGDGRQMKKINDKKYVEYLGGE